MITVKEVKFENWNCVSITDGHTEAIVTTDFGPRIISLTLNGGKNHMVVHEKTRGKVVDSDKFVPYGGHRLWHAPELYARTYFGDNKKVDYEIHDGGCTFTSQLEKETMTRRGFDVSMKEDGEVVVTHFIKNEGLFDIELSIWGLSQFVNGGLLVAPHSTVQTELVANACISLWPYARMNDRRVYWGDKYVTVKPDGEDTAPFKFGMSLNEGFAAYFNHNQLFVKHMEYYYDCEYPNYGCNFESYTNNTFIEIEALSPLMTIEAGETETAAETWKLYDGFAEPARTDEQAIAAALQKVGL